MGFQLLLKQYAGWFLSSICGGRTTGSSRDRRQPARQLVQRRDIGVDFCSASVVHLYYVRTVYKGYRDSGIGVWRCVAVCVAFGAGGLRGHLNSTTRTVSHHKECIFNRMYLFVSANKNGGIEVSCDRLRHALFPPRVALFSPCLLRERTLLHFI